MFASIYEAPQKWQSLELRQDGYHYRLFVWTSVTSPAWLASLELEDWVQEPTRGYRTVWSKGCFGSDHEARRAVHDAALQHSQTQGHRCSDECHPWTTSLDRGTRA